MGNLISQQHKAQKVDKSDGVVDVPEIRRICESGVICESGADDSDATHT